MGHTGWCPRAWVHYHAATGNLINLRNLSNSAMLQTMFMLIAAAAWLYCLYRLAANILQTAQQRHRPTSPAETPRICHTSKWYQPIHQSQPWPGVLVVTHESLTAATSAKITTAAAVEYAACPSTHHSRDFTSLHSALSTSATKPQQQPSCPSTATPNHLTEQGHVSVAWPLLKDDEQQQQVARAAAYLPTWTVPDAVDSVAVQLPGAPACPQDGYNQQQSCRTDRKSPEVADAHCHPKHSRSHFSSLPDAGLTHRHSTQCWSHFSALPELASVPCAPAASAALTTAAAAVHSVQPIQPVVDVWVLAGQSNCVGWNQSDGQAMPAAAAPWPDKILCWDSTGREWKTAVPNVHLGVYGYADAESCGPDMAFARNLICTRTADQVGLVPTACGGTNLFEQWPPGEMLWSNMVKHTTAALAALGPSGRLAGIIWIQGESDAFTKETAEAYGNNFTAWLSSTRAAMRSHHPCVPVVLAVMATRQRSGAFPFIDVVAQQQRDLTARNLRKVDMAGYEFFDAGDGSLIHLTKAGCCALGTAMAYEVAAYSEQQQQQQQHTSEEAIIT